MELTNSKRLLYTANYVTTQLTPEEQRNVESKPGGGYPKANLLRSLDLKPQDLDRLETAMNAERVPQHRAELRNLFAIAQKLADSEHPMSMMELASAMAPISYDAITHFVELSATAKDISMGNQILLFSIEQRTQDLPDRTHPSRTNRDVSGGGSEGRTRLYRPHGAA